MENQLVARFIQRLPSVKVIACIDAGASKIAFQLFTKEGEVIPISKDLLFLPALRGKAGNLTNLKKEAVLEHFQEMFQSAQALGSSLQELFPEILLVCGAAGTGTANAREDFITILCRLGFQRENILLCSDADLLLQLTGEEGAVLICGTGAICLGKKGSQIQRCGGLGRFLGDEGSGHYIGLQALKAVLAYEYGWGETTSLSKALYKHFQKESLMFLISSVNKAEISATEIASLAVYVLEEAEKEDVISMEILKDASAHLAKLLLTVLTKLDLQEPKAYLYGGIFKSAYFYNLIEQKILEENYNNLSLVNLQDSEVTTLVIKQVLSKNFSLDPSM